MLSTLSTTLAILTSMTSATETWNYENFDWGTSSNFCGPQYMTQSPININTVTGLNRNCPSSSSLNWALGTNGPNDITSFTLKNTGHSLSVTPNGQNFGVLTNQFGASSEGNYCLGSFHVHWGETDTVGSEHTINGIAAALEMHFVHYLCKYGSISGAVTASKNVEKALAVVSVLYIPAKDDDDAENNHFLNYIIQNTLNVRTADQTHQLLNVYSMEQLVPSNIKSNPSFFYYDGSLTTPDCNPIVRWHVLADPMYITSAQLQTLRTSLFDHSDNPQLISHNYRPVQLINNRNVYLCGHQDGAIKDSDDSDDSDVHHGHFESDD